MSYLRRLSIYRWSAVLMVALAGRGLQPRPALAQATKKTTEAPVVPAQEVQTVQLRYARAFDMAKLLQKFFADVPLFVVADERTNSLLLRVPAAKFAEIRELIKKVDAPADDAEAPRRKIWTFELRSVEPDENLEASLRLVFGQKVEGNFAVDRARKLVLVSADQVTAASVEALLLRLDRLRPARPGGDAQVRIVWLVNATGKGVDPDMEAPAPPDDLKEVLPGLAKLGIPQPRVAAQFLVNAKLNAQFLATGTARLGSDPWDITVSGQFGGGSEPPEMRVVIEVSGVKPAGKKTLCHLETNISAPRGHLVVLGVTPTESTTSAFIVQVLGEKAKQDAGKK